MADTAPWIPVGALTLPVPHTRGDEPMVHFIGA
jgi:hypothetical protein